MDDVLNRITYTKPHNPKETIKKITTIIRKSYKILEVIEGEESTIIKIVYENHDYSLVIHAGRIQDNGFPNKRRPEIKRIQVRPINEEMYTDSNQCFLLCGLAYFDKNPVLTVWNPFTFKGYKTNRSAYVNVYSIKQAYEEGIYFGSDCGTNVYVCRKGYFGSLLKKYIKDTKYEEIEW